MKNFISRNRVALLIFSFCASLGSGLFSVWWIMSNALGLLGRGAIEIITIGKYENPNAANEAAMADILITVGAVGCVIFAAMFFYILLRGAVGLKQDG